METQEIIGVVLGGILLIIGIGIVALQPYFEAKSFNECTGGNASYMTALFTELRVQECHK